MPKALPKVLQITSGPDPRLLTGILIDKQMVTFMVQNARGQRTRTFPVTLNWILATKKDLTPWMISVTTGGRSPQRVTLYYSPKRRRGRVVFDGG